MHACFLYKFSQFPTQLIQFGRKFCEAKFIISMNALLILCSVAKGLAGSKFLILTQHILPRRALIGHLILTWISYSTYFGVWLPISLDCCLYCEGGIRSKLNYNILMRPNKTEAAVNLSVQYLHHKMINENIQSWRIFGNGRRVIFCGWTQIIPFNQSQLTSTLYMPMYNNAGQAKCKA